MPRVGRATVGMDRVGLGSGSGVDVGVGALFGREQPVSKTRTSNPLRNRVFIESLLSWLLTIIVDGI